MTCAGRTTDVAERMQFPIRGEVVGADFLASGDTDTVIVWVAVPRDTAVGKARVVLLDADDYERSLPTADDVLGSLG